MVTDAARRVRALAHAADLLAHREEPLPRDPAMIARAQAYLDEAARLRAAKVPSRPAEPSLTRAAFDAYSRSFEEAVARMVAQERRKVSWRLIEAERRIAELEARLAGQEGPSHDRG